MTPSEIIRADAIERGLDPAKVLTYVAAMLKQQKVLMLQKNNSVLILQRIEDNNASLHLFTEDSPLTLAKSIKYFIDKIAASDLRAVYGKADNEQIVEMLRRLGVEIQESDNPRYNWMAFV